MKNRIIRLFFVLLVVFLIDIVGGGQVFYLSNSVYADSTDTINIAAATGSNFSLIASNDGVKAWGYNGYGQLGLGNTTNYNTPQTIPGLAGLKQLVAGSYHALALMDDGTVKAWGYNGYGQLGLGNTTSYYTPQTIPDLTGVKQIAAGANHTLALMDDGTVKAWGHNGCGQLGLGNTTDYTTPQSIPNLTGVKQIAAGNRHTLALMEDGTVKAWGYNYNGQLGTGNTTSYYTPQIIPGLTEVKQLAVGQEHCLALLNNGKVKAWGYNQYGQLGKGMNSYSYNSPQLINSLSDIKQLAAADKNSMAVNKSGSLFAWGYNYQGQLGIGYTSEAIGSPRIVLSEVGAIFTSFASNHSIAILFDGSIKSWGDNTYGALGLGSAANPTSKPTTISGLSYYNPSFSVTVPIQNQTINISEKIITPSITFLNSSNNPVVCKYYVDSEPEPRDMQTIALNTAGQNLSFSSLDIGELIDGKHTIRIDTEDGICSSSRTTDFIVDHTAPTPRITNMDITTNSLKVTGVVDDNLSGFNDGIWCPPLSRQYFQCSKLGSPLLKFVYCKNKRTLLVEVKGERFLLVH